MKNKLKQGENRIQTRYYIDTSSKLLTDDALWQLLACSKRETKFFTSLRLLEQKPERLHRKMFDDNKNKR
jgi:hypothetical protein